MRAECDDERLRLFIGDVRDQERLTMACRDIDVLVHAAAIKRVEVAEYNPSECIRTNIIGAESVIAAALANEVTRVVALSTDKAAAPNTLYGASKLCAERLFVCANSYAGKSSTRFSCTRYGNILASTGSVVQTFRESGNTLRVTDPEATRFWMTQDQAVGLVLFALEEMTGGEVFVPKTISSKVVDLAIAINPMATHLITGMRPGEKRHECLTTADESRQVVEHDDGYVILPAYNYWDADPYPGVMVPDGWAYRSDTNVSLVGPEAVRRILEEIA
jgi:UDP-N-acetylglucosamine 4,6-dehydratase